MKTRHVILDSYSLYIGYELPSIKLIGVHVGIESVNLLPILSREFTSKIIAKIKGMEAEEAELAEMVAWGERNLL